LDPALDVSSLDAAAARRAMPLAVLDVEAGDARALYRHGLALIRPDQHVAWRGDRVPADALELIDRVRGALDGG
ncbi:MAG: monooxygenase, partial [Burkholderiales bacterium]